MRSYRIISNMKINTLNIWSNIVLNIFPPFYVRKYSTFQFVKARMRVVNFRDCNLRDFNQIISRGFVCSHIMANLRDFKLIDKR